MAKATKWGHPHVYCWSTHYRSDCQTFLYIISDVVADWYPHSSMNMRFTGGHLLRHSNDASRDTLRCASVDAVRDGSND